MNLKTIELVANALQTVAFPTLNRPPVKPTDSPTEDLVQWGTKVYTYSVTAHLRRILDGLVQVATAENIAAATVISRHAFEWAAHACYMSRNLKNYAQRKDWGRAWTLLTVAVVGNLWMKQHGSKYAWQNVQPPLRTPDPLSVANVISAYEQYLFQKYGVKQARENYGLLSEFSHPNAACLQQYHKHGASGRELEIADADPISPLPFVNWCLLDLLVFLDALLELSKETTIRPSINGVLAEIEKRAPSTRT